MSERIAVLMGGLSAERQVSLKSGRAVAQALRSCGHDVVEIDVGPDLPFRLRDEGVTVAWIALHGAFGEDGVVQGVLELMRIPYTGSGVGASAMAIDKIVTKRLLEDTVVRLPADEVWRRGEPVATQLDLPVVVKTPSGGSTIGIWMCEDADALGRALGAAADMGERVLIEQVIRGEEITVAVLDGRALPVVSIRPVAGVFDFEAKYTKGRTEYLVPAPIPEQTAQAASEQAVVAYERLGMRGVARADFIVDDDGVPWFLEINSIPGMTATSLSPMAARAAGMSFEELVEVVLRGARLEKSVAAEALQAAPGTGGPSITP